jgi:hypothetical protein
MVAFVPSQFLQAKYTSATITDSEMERLAAVKESLYF